MSTRAQICIKRDTTEFQQTGGIYIYKHSDGYPRGVMPTLTSLVKFFHADRGNDPEYLLAQIVRAFTIADLAEDREYATTRMTGWGLDCTEHGDIQYLYEIDSRTGKIYINGKPYNPETPETAY